MDPMREETEFLLLRRTGELTPPSLQPTDSRTDAHADCEAEAGISATASTPTTPEKLTPTPTPSKSKHSYCHFNIRKKGVFWFDRRHMATPNQNSEDSTNFYGSKINQLNFNDCAFEWEDEMTVWANGGHTLKLTIGKRHRSVESRRIAEMFVLTWQRTWPVLPRCAHMASHLFVPDS